ncbi:hypothetical protein [uncultured Kriegella sp.]|uniref:hypothetical protein n=1 Tax=uncultured Kriegella sp. TaxID=1798910 RepID=UPI0030DD9708|tara:strand:- start:88697 stop:89080 length:384 start_codon:yes stop_codon:yes gene_type:complete
MKSIVLVVITFSIAINIWQCKTAENSFCEIFGKSQEDLRTNANHLFNQFNSIQDNEMRFLKIKDFLYQQDCVDNVEIGKGYLRTQPPMKQIFITTFVNETLSRYIINVSLGTNRGLVVESMSKQEEQ